MNPVTLYILECNDGSYYTGITKDLNRRLLEHKTKPKVSWVKRGGLNFKLVYKEIFDDSIFARKRERYYKKLNRQRLKELIRRM